LILKAIEFLKSKRSGLPISKNLPIYKYYEKKLRYNKSIYD